MLYCSSARDINKMYRFQFQKLSHFVHMVNKHLLMRFLFNFISHQNIQRFFIFNLGFIWKYLPYQESLSIVLIVFPPHSPRELLHHFQKAALRYVRLNKQYRYQSMLFWRIITDLEWTFSNNFFFNLAFLFISIKFTYE